MRIGSGLALGMLLSLVAARGAGAQVQVRLGVPGHATYSELHEALRAGTPAADTVRRIQRLRSPARLWAMARAAIRGNGDWQSGLIALTRLAELRDKAYADSASRLLQRIRTAEGNPFPENPGLTGEDVEPSLQAIILERRRAVQGDSAVLADILKRDERDQNRAVAPLKPAPDAHLLDNTHLDIEGGVRAAIDIVEAVRAGRQRV